MSPELVPELQWRSIAWIWVLPDRGFWASLFFPGEDVAGLYKLTKPKGEWFIQFSGTRYDVLSSAYGNLSEIARILFHEDRHINYPPITEMNADHLAIIRWANSQLVNNGLNGTSN